MKNLKSKLVSGTITFSVLAVLLLAGPVQAFILEIFIPDTNVVVGEDFTIIVNAIREEGETFKVESFLVDLAGPVSITCLFDVNGTKISSCVGMTIEKLSNDTEDGGGYGYSYNDCEGYGYNSEGCAKNFTYKITINTVNYPTGIYKSKIKTFTDEGTFEQNGQDVTLTSVEETLESCSVRAEAGDVKIEEIDFDGKGRLSFYIPKRGASDGRGNLIVQKANKRASYKFETDGILENNDQRAKFIVDGEYKVQREDKVGESAVVTLDKINKKVSIDGNNVKANNMTITFLKGCE